jgi:ubiquinone/menaquinone biosynthesis C-methylase UbiE
MDLSLEENQKIQVDHYLRCQELLVDPQRVEDDRTSCEKLMSFMPEHKKCTVLDLGCGEAMAYDYLAEHDYYGLDCCEAALKIAKKKVTEAKQLKLGMIEEIPFEDEFFDVVWARHILEHSSDVKKTLDEIVRVLKTAGLLIYAVPQGIHPEPAHLFQADRKLWFDLLASKFSMLQDGEHPFNLREYYGVCQKT